MEFATTCARASFISVLYTKQKKIEINLKKKRKKLPTGKNKIKYILNAVYMGDLYLYIKFINNLYKADIAYD